MDNNCAVELRHITKRFGKVVANDSIDLTINRGEILSRLGENGSGKTTLMNMLAGIYFPDEGEIYVNGVLTSIRSPKDAFDNHIGMIHQHYKLVDVFTAAENIVLGLDEPGKLDIKAANARVKEICDRYGFDIDPTKKIYDMSVSQKQTVEIVKVLYRGAVTLNIDRPRYENPVPRLTLQDVTCYDNEGVVRLDHVSFTAMGGEILGVAGIAGSGQRELLESIAGLYPVAEGSSIRYTPEGAPESELVGKTPMQIKKSGVALAFVPEDRLGMGLVGSMGMTGNMMLRSWKKGKGVFVNRKDPNELAMTIWKELEVVTPSTEFPVRRMSGGNVQKVLVGREIASAPNVLMSAYAVRGLDINTSYTIYNLMTEQKMKGVAVIFVGEDLDVLLELCDRILVLCGGKVSGIVDARTATKEEIGLMMTRVGGGKEEAVHA